MSRKMISKRGRGTAPSSSHPPLPESSSRITIAKMITFATYEPSKHYDRLRDLPISGRKTINMDIVKTLNHANKVNAALDIEKFRKLFELMTPYYWELTLEFFCTLLVKVDLRYKLPSEINFRAYGVPYTIDICIVSRAMSIYTDTEMDSPKYSQLVIIQGIFDAESYWKENCDDDERYKPRCSKASNLYSPRMRYLHKVMAHTILGRGGNPKVVNLL